MKMAMVIITCTAVKCVEFTAKSNASEMDNGGGEQDKTDTAIVSFQLDRFRLKRRHVNCGRMEVRDEAKLVVGCFYKSTRAFSTTVSSTCPEKGLIRPV